jgi:hypothetical protein
MREPKSLVLPLHHGVVVRRRGLLRRRLNTKNESYELKSKRQPCVRLVSLDPGLGAGRPVDEGIREPDRQFTDGAFGAVAAVN